MEQSHKGTGGGSWSADGWTYMGRVGGRQMGFKPSGG